MYRSSKTGVAGVTGGGQRLISSGVRARLARWILTFGCLLLTLALSACTSHDPVLPAGNSSSFAIEVHHPPGRVGGLEREAFAQAARRWSQVIVGDLPAVGVRPHQVEQACGAGYRVAGVVDDLLLIGDVRSIDGPGSVVGMAGACLLRADGTPLIGVIVLDRDDVDFLSASGDLQTVVSHELGHVLDMSASGWGRRELLAHDRPDCLESTRVRFTGGNAQREFAALGGDGLVPVEDNGVLGTACSHWDEEALRSEIMTGYLDRDARLSRVTAGALADMGYEVDFQGADSYVLPDASAVRPQGPGRRLTEMVLPPGGVLDEEGIFRPLEHTKPLTLPLDLHRR